MKKVGKTPRQFRYDLNQIPSDYTMKVTNRFKGLDLKNRVPEEYGQRILADDHPWGLKQLETIQV